MGPAQGTNRERQIKKHVLGRAQTAHLKIVPGFEARARAELEGICATLVSALQGAEVPRAPESVTSAPGGRLELRGVPMATLVELLCRMRTIEDISLVIHRARAPGFAGLKHACGQARFDLYLPEHSAIELRTDSTASRVFHEGALRDIVTETLEGFGHTVVAGTDAPPRLTSPRPLRMQARLHRDVLSLGISLAGEPLAHRGYKVARHHTAPLREDIAACILEAAFAHAQAAHGKGMVRDAVTACYVPFAGSGTLACEFLLARSGMPPAALRGYDLERLPFFKRAAFETARRRLIARANAHASSLPRPVVLCVEKDGQQADGARTNLMALCERLAAARVSSLGLQDASRSTAPESPVNMSAHAAHGWPAAQDIEVVCGDALASGPAAALDRLKGHVFVPLNPPYGLRLGDDVGYARIARHVSALRGLGGVDRVTGCVLCPDEASWRAFQGALEADRAGRRVAVKSATSHFTQGGLDIRLLCFDLE